MGGLCVVYVWLGQTSVNENTTNLERVLYVRLTLVWRSSGVYMHTWKNAHIFQHAENVRRGWRTQKMNDVHSAFSSNHHRILTHAQRITTHWPKFFFFCALDVRDGMCDWACRHALLEHDFVLDTLWQQFMMIIHVLWYEIYELYEFVLWHSSSANEIITPTIYPQYSHQDSTSITHFLSF